jgi:hypothetical protein
MKSIARSYRFFLSLALVLLVSPALLSAQTTPKPNASRTLTNVYVTLYGWYDNSPAGNGIAYPANAGYPTIHNVATKGQTYSSPGTFASDAQSGGELAVGTIVYNPHFQKYFILEDECVQCERDWNNSGKYHIDLWAGGNPPANETDVINCEDALTLDGQTIIVNPPNNETVNTKSLFNSNTNTCWNQ